MFDSNNTIVVFAPGAWSAGSAFDDFRKLLNQVGISSLAMDHLSNGAEPPTKGLGDDTSLLRQILTDFADQGKRIVLVGHSYGGIVISAAATGMGLEERSRFGKPGGVVFLVFMAAIVAPRGKSLRDVIGGQLWPWMLVQVSRNPLRFGKSSLTAMQGNYVRPDPTVELVQDIPKHVKDSRQKHAHPHICLGAFLEPATEESWHSIASAYILCTEDIALPPSVQDRMVEILPNPRVFRLKSGHSPFLSMPNETADILEQLCK